jgi:Ca-activated chloride channel family protein
MMKAITTALAPSESQKHVRVVCFMTDGYVGNEAEIIREIGRYPGARVFSFGIGSSVNRYLLDKMAEAGRGEVEYVALNDDGSAAAKRFHERVRSPLLTDISVEWGDLPVTDVYPKRIPDVFSAKPIYITGRYTGSARKAVKLRGTYAGRPIVREIVLDLPAAEPKHDVLATLWARTRIDVLEHEPNSREEITKLGLDYRLMTPFTSFVAVEETIVTDSGKPRRVDVPVEMPEGVSYEGVFGRHEADAGAGGVIGFATSAQQARLIRATPGFVRAAPMVAAPPPPPVMNESNRLVDEARRTVKIDPGLLKQTGSVLVQVFLTDASAATLTKLKALGFQATTKPGAMKMVIGRIDATKLKALSELTVVKYIAPAPITR